jgi:murein L,D-transpeptidase YcbB/YkuD
MQVVLPDMLPLLRLIVLLFLINSCTSSPEKKEKENAGVVFPEQYLLPADSVASFDSSALTAFLSTERTAEKYSAEIRDFYNRRNYTFAWFYGDTLSGAVYTFYDQLRWFWETGTDSLAYNAELDSLLMNTGNAPGSFPDLQQKLRTEFILTSHFFEYARYQYEGRIAKDLRKLDWYIPRGRKNYQMLLDSLVAGVPDLAASEPLNRQYHLLKKQLAIYKEISLKDTLALRFANYDLREGDSLPFLKVLRFKLALRGDLSSADTVSSRYDASLQKGIRNYQQRTGMTVDGKVTSSLISHLNIPVNEHIRTILLNMERLRWVPDDRIGEYIFVNIPEFRLHVNRDSVLLFSMNVVVGKEATQTVVFSGLLSTIVFCPYWNIPQSIIVNEMLPILKRNPGYLVAKNMEVLKNGKVVSPYSINWRAYTRSVPLQIRQRPGPNNSLGNIKFVFPNEYAIYLHDTPARHLFDNTGRSYSHGCIRIAEPVKLAEFLLKDDPQWNTESIEKAMYAGKEQKVNLERKVPVFIGYFTAWVDRNGRLNLRKDIYGHDQRLAKELF